MENNFNTKMFDEALRIVVREHVQSEIDEYNDISEGEKHEFSPEFEAKMSKILKRGKKFRADFRAAAVRVLQRTAIVVLVVLSVSFLSLLTVEAVRTEIRKIITTFYEKYIEIRFADTSSQSYMLDTIEDVYLPSYIPDGYWETETIKSENRIRVSYINDENKQIIYYQNLFSAGISVDGEDYTESDVSINGMDGKIFEYDKSDGIPYYVVIWSDNEYSYRVTGFLDKDEMIKIAESVILEKTEK